MRLPACEVDRHACAEFQRQEGETPAATADRIREMSRQVAEVVTRADEPPVESMVRTGLTLMSLAFNETRYRKYVDDGSCNDATWRHAHPQELALANCDGGIAFSDFQIHTQTGLHLYWGTVREYGFERDPRATREIVVHGLDMIEDRTKAIVSALHMLRSSPTAAMWTTGKKALRMAGEYQERQPMVPAE
jgi:hypothetical protein